MLKAIVFDFDGVLIDSEPLHHQAFVRVFEPMGVSFDYPTYLKRYVGFDDRDAIEAITRDFEIDLDPADAPALIERKADALQRIIGAGVEPYHGMERVLREAAEAMPVAISSGALLRDIEAMLAAVADDLIDLFTAIVTADDVARSKPDPQSYQLAAERLGVDPRHCVAIEDTPAGLASARTAGMHTVAVGHTHAMSDLEADRAVEALAYLDVITLRAWFGQ